MPGGKGTALAPKSRSAPQVISPRNKVNVALPLGKITAGDPMTMRAGDWISLAGLVITVIGFAVTIRQLTRIANASEAGRGSRRADREEGAASLAGRSSPDVGTPVS